MQLSSECETRNRCALASDATPILGLTQQQINDAIHWNDSLNDPLDYFRPEPRYYAGRFD
jgi:hypothetical protein